LPPFYESLLTSKTDWGDDPFTLNPHFGTPGDLKSLSDALHGRGMSLMVDIVINHLAANQPADSVDYSVFPAPFNTASAFHTPCDIDFTNQGSIENCWLVTSPPPSLPDIDSENGDVFTAIVNSVVDIVNTYGVDGIRLDTARHIPKQYLSQFQDAVGVFVTGEALDSRPDYVAGYQGPLASAINYPLWYILVDVFMGADFSALAATMNTEASVFTDVNALTNFLDNQDQPRFASRSGDDEVRDRNAITFLMFASGIPVVYYGFEQRFSGAGDPDNRETLWSSGYNLDARLYGYIGQLHLIRDLASNVTGKAEYFSSNAAVVRTSGQYLAMQRGPVVVVVSNVGAQGTSDGFNVSGSQFSAGDGLVDLLSCATATAGDGGAFASAANNGEARVSVYEISYLLNYYSEH
jgi:alpha-amylase